MKIQYMAVIFIIIMLPIILVISAYMQLQVDNLSIALQYDSKLFESTLDGIQAFELNTVNNRFSQIADSLKRDVEAGINTYITTLSNQLGMGGINNEYLLPYIPAVLFTLYDGYYIYAPTYAESLQEIQVDDTDIDGKPIQITTEVSKEPKEYDHEHLLKPYIYYTTRYISGQNTDFMVNYTLDNYMIVYGNIKLNGKTSTEYVTRSGFLSVPDYIEYELDEEKLDTVLARKILEYILPPRSLDNMSQSEILEEFKNANFSKLENIDKVSLASEMGETLLEIMLEERTISNMNNDDILEVLFDSTINEVFEKEVDKIPFGENQVIDEVVDVFTEVKYKDIKIDDSDAKRYYMKSLRFSNWVNENLSNIQAGDAVDEHGVPLIEFENSNTNIFKTEGGKNDPELEESDFSQHRMNSIQISIQTNLNTAIAQYNVDFFEENTYSLTMPILNPIEWNQLTNNVSMVTFLQGLKVGNKIYNNYVIVSSNKNKETINIDDIYYLNTDENGIAYYHRDDCSLLKDDTSNIVGLKNIDYDIYKYEDSTDNLMYLPSESLIGSEGIRSIILERYNDEAEYELLRKDGQITEKTGAIEGKYISGQISEVAACYHCIVDRNYTSIDNLNNNRLKAIYTAIAKEKNNLYKVNEYYNVDILSNYVAPPTTVLGDLLTYSEIKVGDYVTYNANGYSKWRILTKDIAAGKLEIISDGTVQTVELAGRDLSTDSGFAIFTEKVREKLQETAEYYIDGTFATSVRVVGSNDDGSVGTGTHDNNIPDYNRMKESGTLDSTDNSVGNSSGYWLLSTVRDEATYSVMYATQDGKVIERGAILSDGINAVKHFGLRPVVTLNPNTKVIGGSGTEQDPWQLSM